MLKGALLDKDGVIVNSEPLYLQAVRESFKPFVDISEEEFIRRWMIEQTTSAGVIRDYKLNVSLEEIRATREKILERLIREELELMPYAGEVLVIEDNPAAAKQAKLAGCKVIAYPNGFTRGMKFEYADVIVYSLKEVDDRLLARLF